MKKYTTEDLIDLSGCRTKDPNVNVCKDARNLLARNLLGIIIFSGTEKDTRELINVFLTPLNDLLLYTNSNSHAVQEVVKWRYRINV